MLKYNRTFLRILCIILNIYNLFVQLYDNIERNRSERKFVQKSTLFFLKRNKFVAVLFLSLSYCGVFFFKLEN